MMRADWDGKRILVSTISKNSPPVVNQMKALEDDLVRMMEDTKFRDTFLTT